MKNETHKSDMEFDQLLSQALECEVDEERLMQGVHARLDNPIQKMALTQILRAFPMRWPATAATACLLAAFSIGLLLPIDFAAQDNADVIAFAFGDPASLAPSELILQSSFGR